MQVAGCRQSSEQVPNRYACRCHRCNLHHLRTFSRQAGGIDVAALIYLRSTGSVTATLHRPLTPKNERVPRTSAGLPPVTCPQIRCYRLKTIFIPLQDLLCSVWCVLRFPARFSPKTPTDIHHGFAIKLFLFTLYYTYRSSFNNASSLKSSLPFLPNALNTWSGHRYDRYETSAAEVVQMNVHLRITIPLGICLLV